jgi:putative ABC transport system permease protein
MKSAVWQSAFYMARVFSLRHARRDWRHAATVVAILALGVAAFLSIRLANRAAVVSFSGFTESVSGNSDLTLVAPLGNLRVDDLRAMRDALGSQAVHLMPLLRASASLTEAVKRPDQPGGGREFVLLGADWIALQNLSAVAENGQRLIDFDTLPDGGLWPTLRNPHHLMITQGMARRYELTVGTIFPLVVQDRTVPFEVVALLPRRSGDSTVPENLLIMDIAALQVLTGQPGEVSQVDVILPPGGDSEEQLAAVRSTLETAAADRWQVRDPLLEQGAGERMTAAFRLNLGVLSLISLLVGVYLVTQALDAAVVRRRHEIAVLRSLGVSRGELRAAWTMEIGLLGIVGSGLGILLGWLLAQVAVVGVSRTVNALYQSSSATAAQLTSIDVLWGFVLGIFFSALAGWLPLKDAAATPPAQILGVGNWTPGLRLLRNTRLGILLLIAGCAIALLPPLTLEGGGRFPLAGYLTAFMWLTGGTMVVASLFRPLAAVGSRAFGNWPAAAIGISRLRRASSRHRLAAAGLFVAVAMASAMAILVGSFEQTVVRWMDVRFQSDVYITSSGSQSADTRNRIRAETWQAIAADPRVAAIDPFLRLPMDWQGKSTFIAGADLSALDTFERLWLQPPPSNINFRQPHVDGSWPAIANEAFMQRYQLRLKDVVTMPTASGERLLRIVGIEAEYGNEQGQIVVQREHLQAWSSIDELTNITVRLLNSADSADFIADWQQRQPALGLRGNRELRTTALTIFRQTFAVTHALEILALFIALAGLALALDNILRESRDQLKTLRQLGMRRNEIATVTMVEGLGIALAGLLGGLLLGWALGYLLVFVINKQSFGWTLQWDIPWLRLLTLAILVMTLAALIAWLTGRRALKTQTLKTERLKC